MKAGYLPQQLQTDMPPGSVGFQLPFQPPLSLHTCGQACAA
nr:hypothetical protein [Pseudomonas sp. Q1-7]